MDLFESNFKIIQIDDLVDTDQYLSKINSNMVAIGKRIIKNEVNTLRH